MIVRIIQSGIFLVCLSSVGALPGNAQWTESRGQGWIQVAVFHQDTQQIFNEVGRSENIFADGHAITTSLFLTGVVGVAAGVDVWFEAPVHSLVYTDAAGRRQRTGLGDIRLFGRVGTRVLGIENISVAVRAGVKIPGSDFPVDSEIIPLGEGQRDWELMLEAGHSFHPLPVYLMGWLGHRWREGDASTAIDPGNEVFFHAVVGGTVAARVSWKAGMEGSYGEAPIISGIPIPSARREITQMLTSVGYRVGPGWVEAGARVPVAGRNILDGAVFSVGYFTRFSLP